jgi:3-deoxy-D-manno-octulosonic-acid transferase
MSPDMFTNAAFILYNVGWTMVMPFLRLNHRLGEGFAQRTLRHPLPGKADIWIQAASVGESYLAWELLRHLTFDRPMRILITTNTRQGMEILAKAVEDRCATDSNLSVATAYFPFDKPSIMKRAVALIQPRIMVLLESEMWPAHLKALKKAGSKILVINGRMSAKSLKGYHKWSRLWYTLRPDRIMAISEDDAGRFGTLFGPERVSVMPNIKFDMLKENPNSIEHAHRLAGSLLPETKFVVFGSVRREEEDQIQKVITEIFHQHPEIVVGLFPRHLHRQRAWITFLNASRIPWRLRSEITQPTPRGSVILWDTFGELTHAYHLATAAFVGGTLAPLMGQNFLEPLISGVLPVIGPYWKGFHWVGEEIIERGLVRVAHDWKEVANILARDVIKPASRGKIREEALRYVKNHQGGTAIACRLIREYFA